jgi:peptidoglycan/xylan/chitin deacetylase (PgdA/CDA1 family)
MSKRIRSTIGALLLALTATSAGAAPGTTYFYGQTACRDVALTFDVEFSRSTAEMVKKLDELEVKATFFLLGSSIDAGYGDLVKQIAAKHQIGNHSYSHPSFSQLTPGQMQAELTRTEALILNLTGRSSKPFFRPPYGDGYNNQTVLKTVGQAGYTQVIHWSVDTNDWRPEQTVAGVTAAILNGAKQVTEGWGKDPIVLMHSIPGKTLEGMAAAVPVLRERGYQFLTVAEMLDPALRAQRDWGGSHYRSQAGDTPSAIAACHNITTARLLAYNDLVAVLPGVEISIPQRDEVIIRLNGQRLFFPVRPRLVGGRTMVHVRLAERLGAQVTPGSDGSVTVTLPATGKVIRFVPGQDQVRINGQTQTMVKPALIENDRLLVPLVFLMEQFGLNGSWNADSLESSLTN